MKKILTIIIILATTNVFSQILPNNDMEEWEWDIFNQYQDPINWNTPNEFLLLTSTEVVSRSDDSYSGSSSAMLETKYISLVDMNIPGILSLADFTVNLLDSSYTMSGGYFLQENVSRLTGWYKYSGEGEDFGSIFIYNFKNTAETGYDTIGVGYVTLENSEEWQEFSVEMQLLKNLVPDTFNVVISSSTLLNVSGSKLWIDKLSIEINTGIIDLWNQKTPLKVYPNPATDLINFSSDKVETGNILTIYDNFGRKITEKEFTSKVVNVNTSGFAPGVYTYKLHLDNKILNSGTFIKN